jgi:flagellar basal-body rod protein FlgB
MVELDPSAAVAARALDALFLRQLAVAHNMANANSPSFAPLRVTFEQALKRAYAASGPNATQAIRNAAISVEAMTNEPVRTDVEVSLSAENAMRYSTLLTVIDRKLQTLALAIREGRPQ